MVALCRCALRHLSVLGPTPAYVPANAARYRIRTRVIARQRKSEPPAFQSAPFRGLTRQPFYPRFRTAVSIRGSLSFFPHGLSDHVLSPGSATGHPLPNPLPEHAKPPVLAPPGVLGLRPTRTQQACAF